NGRLADRCFVTPRIDRERFAPSIGAFPGSCPSSPPFRTQAPIPSPRMKLLLRVALFLSLLFGSLVPAQAAVSDLIIAFLPKSKGNAYFISCKAGAEKAAKELGVQLLFDGPTDSNAAKQNEIVENWITLGVDVIAVAAENREGISTALRKAQRQ